MKKILMTNMFLEKYTGSELHIIEMADMFASKGYEVTIAVMKKAYPMLAEAEKFNVVECLNEKLETTFFDIIFVQHFAVFDYLLARYELSYDRLIVSKLSVFEGYETLPVCWREADMILCVSEECAKHVEETIGKDERIRIFENSVTREYFEAY